MIRLWAVVVHWCDEPSSQLEEGVTLHPGDQLTAEQVEALPDWGWEVDGEPAHNSRRAKTVLLRFMREGIPVYVKRVDGTTLTLVTGVGLEYRVPRE